MGIDYVLCVITVGLTQKQEAALFGCQGNGIKISGLGGIVSDKVEELEKQVTIMVSDILGNHSESSMFDYYGDGSNMLSSSAKYDASLRI